MIMTKEEIVAALNAIKQGIEADNYTYENITALQSSIITGTSFILG